jgi:hypothetical protein
MKRHFTLQGNFTWNKLMNKTGYLNNFGPGSTLARIQDPGATLIGNDWLTRRTPTLTSRATTPAIPVRRWSGTPSSG